MSKQYAGWKRLGYIDGTESKPATRAAAIAAVDSDGAWIPGKISPESALNPEKITTETVDGRISGGASAEPSIMVLSDEFFDQLAAKELPDTEDWWVIEAKDGRVYISREPVNIQVRRMDGVNARDGITPMEVTFEKIVAHVDVMQLLPESV